MARTGSCPGRMPMSPSTVRAMMLLACPDHTTRSAATTSTCIGSATGYDLGHASAFLLQLGPPALDVLQVAQIEERLLGNVIHLAVANHPERLDGLVQGHRRAWDVRELRRHVGVLAQELLNAPRPVDDDLVSLGQLVDTEDRNDVLQFLVALQD